MARTTRRPPAAYELDIQAVSRRCPVCHGTAPVAYTLERRVTRLDGVVRLHLHVRRCRKRSCPLFRKAQHAEAEGHFALPDAEVGLDVIAFVGSLRYREHRSVPEIHRTLLERQVQLSERTVTNLLDRYDELLALRLSDSSRLQAITRKARKVILAIDGLQPDVGHEVLWVVRDVISGEVLAAQSLLSATEKDLCSLLTGVKDALKVPVAGVISDGQHSIRGAVALALPGVPHQLCHFHYLREAAKPIYEADRHAKKELKKRVRGVRALERKVEDRTDAQAEVVKGYCAAVRSALTDDHRAPLRPSGLLLQKRLSAVSSSLSRAAKGGAYPASS